MDRVAWGDVVPVEEGFLFRTWPWFGNWSSPQQNNSRHNKYTTALPMRSTIAMKRIRRQGVESGMWSTRRTWTKSAMKSFWNPSIHAGIRCWKEDRIKNQFWHWHFLFFYENQPVEFEFGFDLCSLNFRGLSSVNRITTPGDQFWYKFDNTSRNHRNHRGSGGSRGSRSSSFVPGFLEILTQCGASTSSNIGNIFI